MKKHTYEIGFECIFFTRMITKLTLSIPDRAIQKGKQTAKARGTSLSKLVTSFLQDLGPENGAHKNIDARVLRMLGAYKLPPESGYEEHRLLTLIQKHLR